MATRSRTRALLVGLGAFVLFGGWAAFANREHGIAHVVRAGLAQGSFSFISSTCSVLLLEYLYGLGRTPARQVVLGAAVTPAIILGAMTVGHLIAGTPNVVATLLPSWVSGLAFCIVYSLTLRRVRR